MTFRKLFTFADSRDILYMFLGCITACVSGAVMPLFSLLFADITTIYAKTDPIPAALASAIKFFILGAAAFSSSNFFISNIRFCYNIFMDGNR